MMGSDRLRRRRAMERLLFVGIGGSVPYRSTAVLILDFLPIPTGMILAVLGND